MLKVDLISTCTHMFFKSMPDFVVNVILKIRLIPSIIVIVVYKLLLEYVADRELIRIRNTKGSRVI